MTNTEVKTVLGRPVTGAVTAPYGYHKEQWDPEKFLVLLDAVLDTPGVDSVKWTQYTPYFNDGDPCTFSTGEPYIKLVGGDEEAGDYEDGYLSSWSDELNGHQVKAAFEEWGDSLGHFQDFLEESFGDHAEITATKEGFDIGEYSHD